MSLLHRLRRAARNVLRRAEVERELDDELRAYVELLVDEKMRAGMAPDAARRAALLELGGVDRVKDEVRDARAGSLVETLARDARYALRTLARSRTYTVAAVVALALGLGATSAIYSVVDGVLLRPLPYREPGRIMVVMHQLTRPVSPANFFDWKRESRSFADMAAAQYWTANVGATSDAGGFAERVQALRVTPNALPLAGVAPLLGRHFLPEEGEAGRDRVVLLSWGFWQTRLAADPRVIGRRLTLDGESYTVVGVMPRGYDFPLFWATGVQLWSPLALGANAGSRGMQTLRVFARLRPGVTLEQARAEVGAITARLEREFPGTNRDVTVTPLPEIVVGNVRVALLVLLAAVAFVLLIACANVAHMALARAAARQKELSVRAALGASRARLVGQLLVESLILAAAAGAVGLLLARGGIRALLALAGASIPRADAVTLDWRVVAFTAAVALATGVGFGLLPALRASRDELADALRDGARGTTDGAGRHRLRDVLVASEFALAVVLLAGAGLAMRSFATLRAIDPGFDPRNVLSAVVSLTGTAESAPGRRAAFYERLLERVRALPGVESASIINHLPIAGDLWGVNVWIEGRPAPRRGEEPHATYRVLFPGYFRAMRLPLVRGRDFIGSDRAGAPRVAIVNETFVRRHWPGEDPIGKRMATSDPAAGDSVWMTVVGVAKDAVQLGWSAPPEEELYVPYLQERMYLESPGGHVGAMTLVIRAACADRRCDAGALAPAVRGVVASLDRGVPVAAVQTMEEVVDRATARPRFTLVLLAAFAAVALALAAVGIFAVLSYAVSRRTREIGVRMALGARPGSVTRLVVGHGLAVAAAGGAVGLAGALALTRAMSGLLYGVRSTDPATYAAVVLLLGAVALLACWLPARRAVRIDPVRALRND